MIESKMKTVIMVSILILSTALAFSQPVGPLSSPGSGYEGMPKAPGTGDFHCVAGPVEAIRIISRYLELTEAQKEAIRLILEEAKAGAEPVQQSLQSAERELKDELNSEDPSIPVAGTLVLEIHELREVLEEIREEARKQVIAQLTPEQLEKLEDIRRAAALQPVVRAFVELGLLPPHPQRPGLEKPSE